MAGYGFESMIQTINIKHMDIDIPIDIDIKIKFSKPMDESTLDSSNIILIDSDSNTTVDCTYSYDNTNGIYLLTVTPNSNLQSIHRYELIIKGASTPIESNNLGIIDIFGQRMLDNYELTFTTSSSTTVLAPTLLYPNNRTSITDTDNTPYFTWTTISDASSYHIQICIDDIFNNNIYDSIVIDNNITPAIILTPDTQYWWRVCSIDSNDNNSEWSETFSFYFGNIQEGYISPEDSSSTSPIYTILRTTPSIQSSDIPLDKLGPIIIYIQGNEISNDYINSNYIYVYSESIEGRKKYTRQQTGYDSPDSVSYEPYYDNISYFPKPASQIYRQITISGEMAATITNTYADNINTITITPTDELYYRVNNRYYVVIDIPNIESRFWFTSYYEPMFATVNRIKQVSFNLLNDVDEDLLNYTIRYKTLEAIDIAINPTMKRNTNYLIAGQRHSTYPFMYSRNPNFWVSDQYPQFSVKDPPDYVCEYVVWASICDILNSKIIQQRLNGNVKKALGDLSISRSPTLLTTLRSMIPEFEEKREYYKKWITGHTDQMWAWADASIRDIRRSRINRGSF